jgi:peptidoglycan L-alanyl-D-glutamate endopeptidase CwlK
MAVFGTRSKTCLESCTQPVQDVCNSAIYFIDFAVTTGHRTHEEQARLYAQGRTMPGRIVTNARPGDSVHNHEPSKAFDFCPWPVDWDDLVGFGVVAGVLQYVGWTMGYDVKWGGNWDSFVDYPHIEVRIMDD